MIGDYAKQTVVLRSLMENEQTRPLLDNALSTYPLYGGKKEYDLIPTREALNEKILNHYKYREIGFETVGRFLDELKITMHEIMPYYNELFKTVETMADLPSPFDNVDVTETYEETRTHTTETEGQTTGSTSTTTDASATSNVTGTGTTTHDESASRKFSDTPQNSVSNLNNYLTEYSEEDKEQTDTSNSTTKGTDTSESTTSGTDSASTTGKSEGTETNRHTYTRKGNQGVSTYAHDMLKYRTQIVDVVDRIIHDRRLAELFMLVW